MRTTGNDERSGMIVKLWQIARYMKWSSAISTGGVGSKE